MRTTLPALVLLTISAAAPPASAAFIPVYGAPQKSVIYPPVSGVNDAGTVVGATDDGGRAIRWSALGGTELGHLGTSASGATSSGAAAVNEAGTAVGYANRWNASGFAGPRAVRWNAGGTAATELGNLGLAVTGVTEIKAYAVNNAGAAAGFADKFTGSTYLGYRAVRWPAEGTAATELGTLGTSASGFARSEAIAINDAGTAIGFAEKYNGAGQNLGRYAVRWGAAGTAATELGTVGDPVLVDGTATSAWAINSAGTIVGYSAEFDDGFAVTRPVRWEATGTTATRLDLPGATYGGVAGAINETGAVAGVVGDVLESGPLYAVRWDASGAITLLQFLDTVFRSSYTYDINEGGIVVGYGYVGVSTHAVYWASDGAVVDLNSLIDPAGGWTLTRAQSISDTGWIAGYGTFDPDGPGGQAASIRAFLMQVPAAVPEPSSLALLILAVPALLRRRTWRSVHGD